MLPFDVADGVSIRHILWFDVFSAMLPKLFHCYRVHRYPSNLGEAMGDFLQKPTDWIQAIAAIAALFVSILALVKSNRSEKEARRLINLNGRLSSLRLMVQEVEQAKLKNLGSPLDDRAKMISIVASKCQAYEAIFSTYNDCLKDEDRSKIDKILKLVRNHSEAAVKAVQEGGSVNAKNEYSAYVDHMAKFVTAMETIPQLEMKKVSLELHDA